nr:putative D117 [uncultured bacterium]
MLRKVFFSLLVLIGLPAAAAYQLWPSAWTINAPMPNDVLNWGTDVAPERTLREKLHLPDGFQVNRYAVGLGQARIMRWTSGGDLLVSIPRKGEIALIGRDTKKTGRGGAIRALLTGLDRPHGIEIQGGYLYVAETDAILRVPFDEATGKLTGVVERFITGLPADGNHWSRTLRMGPDGWMYVSVGSSCNVCIEKDNRRAAILRFRPDDKVAEIYAEGLRNTVGFDWDTQGRMWGVDNGRDLLGDDLPPEELNLIQQGKFYGWPFRYGNNVPDPDFGQTPDPRVASAVPPAYGFPAHMAPLSVKFIHGPVPGLRNAALVTLHGSWNRSQKQGYQIMSVHWAADGTITAAPFMTGFLQDQNVLGRPVDTTEGPDGAIYVSDDYAGVIYRVSYGAATPSPTEPAMPAPERTTPPAAPAPETVAPQPKAEQEPENSGETPPAREVLRGEALFDTAGCRSCHGGDRPLAPLKDIVARYNREDIARLLATPPAAMPSFGQLKEDERLAIAAYVLATYE